MRASRDSVKMNKELNDLDKLVMAFVKILDKNKVNYVLVSGYVSILFGRSRSSEDIDLIVERISKKKFSTLWKEISRRGFECITTDNSKNAYENYLTARSAIRFSRKGKFIPNIEFKFPKVDLDEWVLDNRKTIVLNRRAIRISPIELQIPFKLFLATEKDIEDARHLYKLFKDSLDQDLLRYFLENLDKEGLFNKYLA